MNVINYINISFNPTLYKRVSNPQFSINGSIVMRGLTYDDQRVMIVVFDNSKLNLSDKMLEPIMNEFKKELDKYYN